MRYIPYYILIICLINYTNIIDAIKFPCINNTNIYNNYCECPLECSIKIGNNSCNLNKCYNIINDKCEYQGYRYTDIIRLHLISGYTGSTLIFIKRYDLFIYWLIPIIIQILINLRYHFKTYNDNGEKKLAMADLKSINYVFLFLYTIKWLSELLGMLDGSLLDGNGCIIK